jgi:hypothetical protein
MELRRLSLVEQWKCCNLVGLLQLQVYQYESNFLMLLYVIIRHLTYSNMEISAEILVELMYLL